MPEVGEMSLSLSDENQGQNVQPRLEAHKSCSRMLSCRRECAEKETSIRLQAAPLMKKLSLATEQGGGSTAVTQNAEPTHLEPPLGKRPTSVFDPQSGAPLRLSDGGSAAEGVDARQG